MMPFALTITVIVAAGLAITALCAIIRIILGPTILDRMVASDVLLTTLVLVVGADMVVRRHTESIPLMTVIAATATFATIVVARYVKRRSTIEAAQMRPGADADEAEGASHV